MGNNLFAPLEHIDYTKSPTDINSDLIAPNYSRGLSSLFDRIVFFLTGFIAGFIILYIFYKIIPLSICGGVLFGISYILIAMQNTIKKRLLKLRMQFLDLLEALSVSMRAGSPILKALQSAKHDLLLIYPSDSDIIIELDIIVGKFDNGVPLSVSFLDWANRCGLEDIASFASIYATIEGKSSRAAKIIRETQQIIADKIEIEMEIETMMTATKNEVNIMLFMPLAILGVIGYLGAGFMDAIYTTATGRIVATIGLALFITSYIMARKISDIKL
ncbi:MAG: type II secretion system F family protein [Firmicutes bacterium]|nr:type II secretion system F family protein [Bacillota bacterium]